MLCALSERYGEERVALLVGNRDLNKLRYTAELSDGAMATKPEDVPPPHWDPGATRYATFLEGLQVGGAPPLEALNTRPNRLKWMLAHTLGCPETFEFRRDELEALSGESASDVGVLVFGGVLLNEGDFHEV